MLSQPQNTKESLFDLVTGALLRCPPPDSFAYKFLAQSTRPPSPASHLAYELLDTNLSPQYRSVQGKSYKLHPLLLSTSEHLAQQETRCAPWGEEIPILSFSDDFDAVSTYPAGLYLTETKPHRNSPYEDGCKLVLPFFLGANKFVQTNDGALVGENLGSHKNTLHLMWNQ
jgi:hypothetical protein